MIQATPRKGPRSSCGRVVAGLLLAAVLAWACAEPMDPPEPQRWIEDDPQDTLILATQLAGREVESWPPSAREWRPRGLGPTAQPGVYEVGEPEQTISLRVDLEAARVDYLDLEIEGSPGTVLLSWTGHGEEPLPHRVVQAIPHFESAGTHRLVPQGHDGWEGRISRLRFHLRGAVGEELRVGRLTALAADIPPTTRDRLASQAWKVLLETDQRNALPLPSSNHLRHPVTVPPEGRFHLAYGVATGAASTSPWTFEVAVVETGERTLVWRSRWTADEVHPPSWSDATVDLGAWAGRKVSLVIHATPEDPDRAVADLPLVANPTLAGATVPSRNPNVILVSIDTLRADRLSLNGYERQTTPHLDRWARTHAVNFRHAVVSSTWTLPSHVTMLTGIDAIRHGVDYLRPIPSELDLLAEVLRRNGYSTAATTGPFWVSPSFGFSQGFDIFRRDPHEAEEKLDLETSMAWIEDWLHDEPAEPFFLFLHTFDVHNPYHPREPWFTTFAGSDARIPGGAINLRPDHDGPGHTARWLLNWWPTGDFQQISLPDPVKPHVDAYYDSGVAHTDLAMGRLLKLLDQLELTPNTVVVVTSDHGEALGESELAGHSYLTEDNLLVPLLIAYPASFQGGREVDAQVRSADLVPTILELAGIEPPEGLDGVSLLPWLTGAGGGPAPPASTYTPNTNRGLGIRLGDAGMLRFDDSIWASPAERVRSPDRTAGWDVEALSRMALEALDEAPGLRLELTNSSPGPWKLVFKGPSVHRSSLKTTDRVIDAEFELSGPDEVRFSLAAGTRLTLRLADPRAGWHDLTIRQEGLDPPLHCRFRIDPVSPSSGFLHRDPGGCRATSTPGSSNPLGRTWWQGGSPGAEDRSAGLTPEERAELRALGYLN